MSNRWPRLTVTMLGMLLALPGCALNPEGSGQPMPKGRRHVTTGDLNPQRTIDISHTLSSTNPASTPDSGTTGVKILAAVAQSGDEEPDEVRHAGGVIETDSAVIQAQFSQSSDPFGPNQSPPMSPGANPNQYVASARAAEQANRLQEAEQHYLRALEVQPNHFDALVGLGRVNHRLNLLPRAYDCFRLAVDAQEQNAMAHNHVGLALAGLGQRPQAVGALRRAVDLDPTNPRYRNNLAAALVDVEDVDGALRELSAVHSEPVACYNLGYLLAKKGDRAQAVSLFQRALQRDPSFEAAKAWLARLGEQPPIDHGSPSDSSVPILNQNLPPLQTIPLPSEPPQGLNAQALRLPPLVTRLPAITAETYPRQADPFPGSRR